MAYKNKIDKQKYQKEYREAHKEQRKVYGKYYRQIYKEYFKKYRKEYYLKNKEKMLKQSIDNSKNRRKTDSKFRLNQSISASMRNSLKNGKNGYHWGKLVGYTLRDLIKHLEKQFTSKMNWDNYGSYWVIDHKVPISIFNFSSFEHIDFKRCWALKNLRPLEKTENIKKYNKISNSFQPSLKI